MEGDSRQRAVLITTVAAYLERDQYAGEKGNSHY